MAQSNVIVRLSLKDADAVQRGLVALGADGEKALKRIEAAGRTPSAGLKALGAASDEVRGQLGQLSGQAGALGSALEATGPRGLLAAAGIGAIVVAAVAAIRYSREVVQHFGDIQDASERVGASSENFQALRIVFQDNASSADELSAALEKLHVKMGEALSGSDDAVASFARAGVTLDDLRAAGGDATVVLDLLSKNLSTAGDSGQQTAAAVELLGKGAKGMQPALAALNGGLDKLREEGLKEGTIAAQATTRALAALEDESKRIDDGFKALAAGGAVDVQRAINDVRQLLLDTERVFIRVAEANAGFWHRLFTSPEQQAAEADLADQEAFAAAKRRQIEARNTKAAQDAAAMSSLQAGVADDLSSNATVEEAIAEVNAQLQERLALIKQMRTADGHNAAEFDKTERDAREAARREIEKLNAPGEQKAKSEQERLARVAEAAARQHAQTELSISKDLSSAKIAELRATGQQLLAIDEQLAQERREIALRTDIDREQRAALERAAEQRAGAARLAAARDAGARHFDLMTEQNSALMAAAEKYGTQVRAEESAIASARADAARQAGNTLEALEIEHQQRLQQIRDSGFSAGTQAALVGMEGIRNERLVDEARQTRFTDWLEAQPPLVQDVADRLGDLGSSAADAFAEAVLNGGKLSTVLEGLANDLQKVLLRMAMMKLIEIGANAAVGAFSGPSTTPNAADNSSVSTFAAHGLAFDRGNVIPFARGGVVDRPTLFPMARGAGLMGEAGPEAVMPLRRTRSGDLGVIAGGGTNVTVNVINNAGAKVTTEEQRDENGGFSLTVMIDAVEQAMAQRAQRPGSTLNRALGQASNPVRAR